MKLANGMLVQEATFKAGSTIIANGNTTVNREKGIDYIQVYCTGSFEVRMSNEAKGMAFSAGSIKGFVFDEGRTIDKFEIITSGDLVIWRG